MLRCRRCFAQFPLGRELRGCRSCVDVDGSIGVLEVVYPAADPAIWTDGGREAWPYASLLPMAAPPVSLGEGRTPLLPFPAAGTDAMETYLKLETSNPTGSYKDRMNAVTASIAREYGGRALVASSTGNHGVAVAAYAAAAGLSSVVLFPEEAPRAAVQEAIAHDAMVMRLPWDLRKEVLDQLLQDDRVWLSNRNDPFPWANPYGLEGYKSIAYEIVRDLGNTVPDAVVVPTCGADGLYGIWKGFEEMRTSGFTSRSPVMVAVQPSVGAPLVTAFESNPDRTDVPALPLKISMALSLTDSRSGRLGLAALRESGGFGVTVTEEAIADSVERLGAQGLSVDPASACSTAAYDALAARGMAGRIVSIITGRGARWPAPAPRLGAFHEPRSLTEAVQLSTDWLERVSVS